MKGFRDLGRVGHWPTLLASLLHFEVSFGVWVLLGTLGPFLAQDLHLSPSLKGLVVATPLLAGAAFRIAVGSLADRLGPRRVGTASMLMALAPLAWGFLAGRTLPEILAIGMLLGIAGASFAVALPLASSHYPPSHQGLALGIAGAGNSGTIVAALVAPRVAEHVGWHATLGLAMIPVALAALGFRLIAREAPRQDESIVRVGIGALLRQADCRRFCGLYAVTFGGFVGLASYLPVYLVDTHSISRVSAATFAAVAAGAGSVLRPAGGALGDRFGGARVLAGALSVGLVAAIALSSLPALPVTGGLFVVLLGALGTGNGAIFQMVPQRFGAGMGAVTGLIGAAGGVGGFLLPTILGSTRQATGAATAGFLLFAGAAALALARIVGVRIRWPVLPVERSVEEAA